MKKMQCEVCGSTEIRKISDDIFECQSCGIQYSKNEIQKLLVEITGEVKIDHSKEIENALTRAGQFLKDKEYSKALEYYNKVLDLEPDNEAAHKGIDAINKSLGEKQEKEIADAKDRQSAVKVLKHTVKPDEAVAYFLKSLKNMPDVAPDIYKEIEIMSVNQGYYPFSAVDKQYSGTYEGIACYKKQVPYTDYEKKTDYNKKNQDGTYKTVYVPVTKYREEVDRQQVNGTFLVNHFDVFSVSKRLGELFTSVSPEKYDKTIADDTYSDKILGAELHRTHFNDAILKQLEKQLMDNYEAIKKSLTEVRASEQKDLGGLELIGKKADADWERRMTELFDAEVRRKVDKKVNDIFPGDFHQNENYRWRERYEDVQTFYIPIQVIEYAYRGKFYASAMILTKANDLILSYPCTTELKIVENAAETAIDAAKKPEFPGFLVVLYAVAVAFIVVGLRYGFFSSSSDISYLLELGVPGLACGIAAIIWNIKWKSKKDAVLKKELSENTAVVDDARNKYKLELEKGSESFFKAFSGVESVERAAKAAKNASSYNTDIASVKGRMIVSSISAGNDGNKKRATAADAGALKDSKGNALTAAGKYTVRLIDSGSDKTGISKIVREFCKIGLAAAKEIADTPHSTVAKNLSFELTADLATKLKTAGATVEIEKEM